MLFSILDGDAKVAGVIVGGIGILVLLIKEKSEKNLAASLSFLIPNNHRNLKMQYTLLLHMIWLYFLSMLHLYFYL